MHDSFSVVKSPISLLAVRLTCQLLQVIITAVWRQVDEQWHVCVHSPAVTLFHLWILLWLFDLSFVS